MNINAQTKWENMHLTETEVTQLRARLKRKRHREGRRLGVPIGDFFANQMKQGDVISVSGKWHLSNLRGEVFEALDSLQPNIADQRRGE